MIKAIYHLPLLSCFKDSFVAGYFADFQKLPVPFHTRICRLIKEAWAGA
ncbi:hypothetical protein NEOC65_000331 [Neochlamydia sp. AcF65]|nr:hypothetical protein [Neochlamydia sp. AcF65]